MYVYKMNDDDHIDLVKAERYRAEAFELFPVPKGLGKWEWDYGTLNEEDERRAREVDA